MNKNRAEGQKNVVKGNQSFATLQLPLRDTKFKLFIKK